MKYAQGKNPNSRNGFKKGHKLGLGYQHTKEARLKISNAMLGKTAEKSRPWKGNSVSYSGFHNWLVFTFGHPLECENCGIEGHFKKKNGYYSLHNALKKGRKHSRDINDYLGLCPKCHKRYDIGKILTI